MDPRMGADNFVKLDQVPRWSDGDYHQSEDLTGLIGDPLSFNANGLIEVSTSKFPLDHVINSKLYLWRGYPWNLDVDAVVNSSNENLDEMHSSPGLYAAAGPGLAEECSTLGGCRTGMAKVTNAYDLPARKIIHTVGPRYADKYQTAAENALSHCYRSCLETLIDLGLQSIALGCIYTESKGYPREPAAHVAIRTVRRFLEKHKDRISAIVFCTSTGSDTEIYKRLLPLYFPRNKSEEEMARSRLPQDVGDENGETSISERRIRIKALPAVHMSARRVLTHENSDSSEGDARLQFTRSLSLNSLIDPLFTAVTKDPDQRRKEQWERVAQAQAGWKWAKWLGLGNIGGPPLTAAEEDSLHARYLARANAVNLSEITEMKILYRGGVDDEGRPVLVVVGAHFLLRCLPHSQNLARICSQMQSPSSWRSCCVVAKEMTVRDALNSALDEDMSANSKVYLMGEEVLNMETLGALETSGVMSISFMRLLHHGPKLYQMLGSKAKMNMRVEMQRSCSQMKSNLGYLRNVHRNPSPLLSWRMHSGDEIWNNLGYSRVCHRHQKLSIRQFSEAGHSFMKKFHFSTAPPAEGSSSSDACNSSETISVTFIDKHGDKKTVKVPLGMSMLEAAHQNDIELEGACEGSLACSTCHVIVMDEEYYNKLPEPTDEENDMLDLAFGLTETSRLGCQVIAKPELEGMRLAIPSATRNFAVDGYVPKPH